MRSVTYVLLISTGLMATPSTLLAGAGDLPYKIDNNDFDPATLIWHTESAEIWEDALKICPLMPVFPPLVVLYLSFDRFPD